MTYRAMWPGKVTELNVSDGAYVGKDNVIARLMWTDEHGKSVTAGTAVAIRAPFDGYVRLFPAISRLFVENEPLFRLDKP